MRQAGIPRLTGHTVLLVDDNPEYLEATRILLEHEGHEVLCAANGQEALVLLRAKRVDLALLDYYMPGITGEEVVARLREFDPFVQIILQTGYASERPPRELLRTLDIQGYHDKNDGPEKLLMWMDAGLKAASTIRMLERSRQGLRSLLEATPRLCEPRSLEELLPILLSQAAAALGFEDAFIALIGEDGEPAIKAGLGSFASAPMDDSVAKLLAEASRQGHIVSSEAASALPLPVGETTVGLIYLDRPLSLPHEVELAEVFAAQAAVALRNAGLLDEERLDTLVGVLGRRLFEERLLLELRSAYRGGEPFSMLAIRLGALKFLPDEALLSFGQAFRQAMRATDIAGRLSGEGFAIALPRSDARGARAVAERVLGGLRTDPACAAGARIGLSALPPSEPGRRGQPRRPSAAYFQRVGRDLVGHAADASNKPDKAEARLGLGEPTEWPAASSAERAEAGES